MEEKRTYDVVVFGASGYTGLYVVQELINFDADVKWCAAGRNGEKVRSSLVRVGVLNDKNLDNVKIIEANVDDENSLLSMCKQARVVINCVGPYRFFGEQVVKACVKSGTHHVDVSGEPQYLESMQAKYFHEAKEKGVYIVGACGFDSIPCDLGVEVTKKKFNGDVNSIESYLKLISPKGVTANYGTWQSAVHGLAHAGELKPLRRELKEKVFNKAVPKNNYPLEKRFPLFKSEIVNKWCIPFIGSDRSIVIRTQMFNYEYKNERPVQMMTYMTVKSLLHAFGMIFLGAVFMVFSKFKFGRHLLEEYPEIFSLGTFSKDPPPMRRESDGSFTMIFKASGWSSKLQEPTDQHTTMPDKQMTVVLNGPEAYVATAICVVNAALVILKETDKMPLTGGVYTPGAAFIDTSLAEKLESRGLSYVVES